MKDADLTRANLSHARLFGTGLVGARLAGAGLTGARIHGISAWDLEIDESTIQRDLVLTPWRAADGAPTITVDSLEVAQFVYLLLNNARIRHVIDTITSKVVLLLGRFSDDRKLVLDALRDELRKRDYLPILLDSDAPSHRTIHETISTLAHMSRFIIVDITDPRSVPQELTAIVPHMPSVPVLPLLQGSASPWGMWEHFAHYPWVLPIHRYTALDDLQAEITDSLILPAERKVADLRSPSR